MVRAPHPWPTAPVLTHFDLSGKTVVVTSGCRGIGLEVARGLCEAGGNAAITYTSTPPAEVDNIAATIADANNSRLVVAYKCDVKSKTEVQATIEKVTTEPGVGKLDVVVANAGIADRIAAQEYLEDKFRDIFDVNVNGAFWTAQAAAKVSKDSRKKKKELRIEDRSSLPHRYQRLL